MKKLCFVNIYKYINAQINLNSYGNKTQPHLIKPVKWFSLTKENLIIVLPHYLSHSYPDMHAINLIK